MKTSLGISLLILLFICAAPHTGIVNAQNEDPIQRLDVSDVILANTYRSPDGLFMFRYPAGWFVNEQTSSGGILITVSPQENIDFERFAPGTSFAIVLLSAVAQVTAEPPDDLHERALMALDSMLQMTEMPAGRLLPLTVNDRPGAGMSARTSVFDTGAFLLLVDPDIFIFSSVFSAPGEMESVAPIYLAILRSADFDTAALSAQSQAAQAEPTVNPTAVSPVAQATPAPTLPPPTPVPFSLELSETYASDDGNLGFLYPAGWQLSEGGAAIVLSNVAELGFVTGDGHVDVAPGQFRVLVGLSEKEGRSLTDVLEQHATGMRPGRPTEFTAGDRTGVRAEIDARLMRGTMAVVDLGAESALVITIYHAPQDAADVAAFLPALVESVRYEGE